MRQIGKQSQSDSLVDKSLQFLQETLRLIIHQRNTNQEDVQLHTFL